MSDAMPQTTPPPPPVQTPLTAIFTIAEPVAQNYEALKNGLSNSNNSPALAGVGTIHFARFVFLDNNTKVAIITTYDGNFADYIADFVAVLSTFFDAILPLIVGGAAVVPVAKNEQAFADFVMTNDNPPISWYSAYPTLTVQNILHPAS